MELADAQAEHLESVKSENDVNTVTKHPRFVKPFKSTNTKRRDSSSSHATPPPALNTKCRNCGGNCPHEGGKTACPAYQKQCRACGKYNHFQSVCLQTAKQQQSRTKLPSSRRTAKHKQPRNERRLHTLNDTSDGSSSEDEHGTFRIVVNSVKNDRSKQPIFDVAVAGPPARILADPCASINNIDNTDYSKLINKPRLENTNTQIFNSRKVHSAHYAWQPNMNCHFLCS